MKDSKPYMMAVDFKSPNAARQFTDSLHRTGFAVLMNHPINTADIHAFYDKWAKFFAGSNKEAYLYHKDTQDGFFPITISEKAKGYSIKDLKEYYHYYPWGQIPPEMSDCSAKLRQDLLALAEVLLQWIEDALPESIKQQLSMPLSEMSVNSTRTLLRILHYPPLSGEEEEGAIRAAAHEDINLITLLPMATASGLQVLDTQKEWHDIPCDPGMIVVNNGDMLQECTQAYFPSTTHRVINPPVESSRTSRYSVPLFLHPRDEVRLSPLYTAREYLLERLAELGVL
ncbi:MAG: putative Clavaminate synthase-like [Gammaproteobacteria bacterium]|jgi:isopenicillin N synthase-like dioxygenase|nr:putative Clavaminate synthase-like [Gammaproteobacteria bacterium]